MAKATKKSSETTPRTTLDHIAQEASTPNKAHHNHVNEVLGYPIGNAFEQDLASLVDGGDCGSPVIIAVFDFDHFKDINDTFGKDEGDRVLITVCQHIEAGLPDGARMYRFGGDEFGIIFNCGMEREEVFLLLESLRKTLDITQPDGSKSTISIGIATAFEDATRVPELIRKAEGALYRAKVNGRNKVALARDEKMVPKTSHYTTDQLNALSKLSKAEGIGEAVLLREALDMLLKKYDI